MKTWHDKEEFKNHVLEWADRFGIQVRSLAVRPMRNKWASCSTAGSLNFNAQLLTLDEEMVSTSSCMNSFIFFVPNHGRLWKSLMRAHLGDYERIEERLRKIEINV